MLADRYDTDAIGTLDERHFRVVRSLSGHPLRILTADAGRALLIPVVLF